MIFWGVDALNVTMEKDFDVKYYGKNVS